MFIINVIWNDFENSFRKYYLTIKIYKNVLCCLFFSHIAIEHRYNVLYFQRIYNPHKWIMHKYDSTYLTARQRQHQDEYNQALLWKWSGENMRCSLPDFALQNTMHWILVKRNTTTPGIKYLYIKVLNLAAALGKHQHLEAMQSLNIRSIPALSGGHSS